MAKVEKKIVTAAWPRGAGSALNAGDRLKVVYLKFTPQELVPEGVTAVNFIFAHGTGMNKSLWKPHIQAILDRSRNSSTWKVGAIVAIDAVNHGDSGLLNRGKLSYAFDWRDGAKDIIEVVRNEISTTGDFAPSAYSRNILVGHSFGGFQVAHAAVLEPTLFDSCVSIEPVIYIEDGMAEMFRAIMKKVARMLKDDFASKQEAVDYFTKNSFYKVMDPKVLECYYSDELVFEEGKYKTKATKMAQLSTYFTATYSVPLGMKVLGLMEIPMLHVIGENAVWNHPLTADWVKGQIPLHLLEQATMSGEHLCHATHWQECVDIITGYADRRVQSIEENRAEFPEVKFKESPEKLVGSMFELVAEGDNDLAFCYGKPKSKL